MHFVQGNANDDRVKENLIKTFNAFLQGNFFLQLLHGALFRWFYNFPIYPVLYSGVLSSKGYEKAVEECEFFLLMFFLRKSQHRFGHCTNNQSDNFLKGQPTNLDSFTYEIAVNFIYF